MWFREGERWENPQFGGLGGSFRGYFGKFWSGVQASGLRFKAIKPETLATLNPPALALNSTSLPRNPTFQLFLASVSATLTCQDIGSAESL